MDDNEYNAIMNKKDPRFPGTMNYLDWLFRVLQPDEYTPENIKQICAYERRAKASRESGVKLKKNDYAPRIDHAQLSIAKGKSSLKVRPI